MKKSQQFSLLLMLAVLAPFSMNARATEVSPTPEQIEQARRDCDQLMPDAEIEECEKNRLAVLMDPVQRAKLKAASAYAAEVLKACKDSDPDRFAECSKHWVLKLPVAYRELTSADAYFANLDRVIKEDKAKQARVAQTCRRDGIKAGAARIGMTAQQARDCGWGEPENVNRTVTARGVSEQWVYGGGSYLYFENGRLSAIQN